MIPSGHFDCGSIGLLGFPDAKICRGHVVKILVNLDSRYKARQKFGSGIINPFVFRTGR